MKDHGDKLLKEIRNHPRNKTAGIVIVTSSEDRDLAIEKMRQGANDYLWKPIQEQNRKLVDCIANALEARDRLRQQVAPASNGMQPFEGATLVFGADRVLLDGEVLCSSATTDQAKVLRYLAENRGSRVPAKIIASVLDPNEIKKDDAAWVFKAVSEVRKHAKKQFSKKGIKLSANDIVINRRGGTGYEFGPKITIEGLRVAEPVGAKKKRSK